MNKNQMSELLTICAGTEEEKQRAIRKYVPKEIRHERKEKDKNGLFVVKTKMGYYDGQGFVKEKHLALMYVNYDNAKDVLKLFNGKIVRI